MTLIKINPAITRYYKLFLKFHTTRDFYDLPDSIDLNNCLYRIQKARELKRFITVHGRFIVFPKDVEIILGKADYDRQHVLLNIRKESELPEGAPVVISDFCAGTGIDFDTVYDFMNITRAKVSDAPSQAPRAWEKYYKTRDWYDMPDSTDTNNLLHTVKKEGLQKPDPDVRPRIIIYPKDIELYYNYSPENALGFLQDVRKSQGLSISIPVMIADVNKHNERQDNKFLSFIINS
jgi:hypothetical protein